MVDYRKCMKCEMVVYFHCYDVRSMKCHNCLNDEKEDVINKPKHYHDGIQPIEVMESNFDFMETKGFLKGNVIKYVCRSNKKGKELEDLKKAQWNLNKLIEKVENGIHDRGK